jgi:beta-phosphoglucomutase-like phosphatase (HAD superfamily)
LSLLGDDVDKKKPDPKIYNIAAQKLGVEPSECVVVEDSLIGLQAALGAGMRCVITYTPSTKSQVRDQLTCSVGECLQD